MIWRDSFQRANDLRTVGVTNIARAGGYYSGSVTFYAKGQTTACLTLHNVNFANVYFGAFDAHGDFYLDGSTTNTTFWWD